MPTNFRFSTTCVEQSENSMRFLLRTVAGLDVIARRGTSMKDFFFASFALLLSSAVFVQSSPSSTQQAVDPQIVEVPSALPPWPGLSADQGSFTQDLLKQAEAKRPEMRKQVHYQLVTGGQLDDALAGLAFLKTVPGVDAKRVAIVGHSFGGMLTLLSGEHDSTISAEVSFAAGAKSWHASQELPQRVLASVDKAAAPIMLVQAANDFDTAPSTEIAAELDRLRKPHLLKIYPAVGKTSDDGHNLLYLAIPEWEPDVFRFLDANVKR